MQNGESGQHANGSNSHRARTGSLQSGLNFLKRRWIGHFWSVVGGRGAKPQEAPLHLH